jgi:hypothetical protein
MLLSNQSTKFFLKVAYSCHVRPNKKKYYLLKPIPKNFDEAGRHLFFVVVIISVGSNAVAAYTRNNHACLRYNRSTDNDCDQET